MIFNGKKNKQERNRNNLEKEKKENIFKNIYKKYLKKICILTIITLIALFFSKEIFAIEFSEIMYNPIGNDAGREWIELYNPECENLENYFLLENNINHAIRPYSNGTSPNACDYVIICNNCENLILEYNITSRMYESSFTLSNTGEYLAIKINSTIIDEINYSDFMSEAMEGYSLTKYFETENTTWIQTDPSPGKYKTIIGNNYLNNNTLMNINDTNETYNNTPHNNTNINDTEIIIINNNEQGCNVSIGIKLKDNKTIYYNKEQIKFYNTLDITPNKNSEFYIEYWVEDIYGNILKNKVQTNNLNEKSYTPNINEKTAGIIFRNKLLNISCNGTEKILNDESEKIILIKNPEWKEKECEKCEKCDLQAYEETSKLKIYIEKDVLTLDAYRGNDRKYVINIGIKNEKNKYVLKQKIMLEKYSETSIEIPLDFKECGNYSIKIEGLGFKDEKEYIVDCKEKIDVDSVVNYKSLSDSMKKIHR
ncbi:MAG: hypothetical protein KatS3mg002_0644 [Candidatus Woesearchaeota archaeon]|nr:MAG: hypothetical protein KatS3mg002_0644 [Candidatus Woesearchaeota archaeon]